MAREQAMAIEVIEGGRPDGTDLVTPFCRTHGEKGRCSDCDPCRSEHPERPGVFCARVKTHPSNCMSEDGLAWHLSGEPLDKYVDEEEYRSNGKPGLRTRASGEGVFVFAMGDRMLGVEQAREMAEVLLRAASHARQR